MMCTLACPGNFHDEAGSDTSCYPCGRKLIGIDWYATTGLNLMYSGYCLSVNMCVAGVLLAAAGKRVLTTYARDSDMRTFEFNSFPIGDIGGVAGDCHEALAGNAAVQYSEFVVFGCGKRDGLGPCRHGCFLLVQLTNFGYGGTRLI
jgi:hypothetical protein